MTENDFSGAEEALKENGEFSCYTSGTSMYPLLRTHKDIVIIKPPSFPLKKNDVPLYKKKGVARLVLHRILRCENGTYVIRGDNTYVKEYVKQSDIVGVLSGVLRNANTKECRYIDCKTGKKYKLYIAYVHFSYPFRHLWKINIRPALSKIKHTVFR